jgi:hypothetical protein
MILSAGRKREFLDVITLRLVGQQNTIRGALDRGQRVAYGIAVRTTNSLIADHDQTLA